MTVTVASVISAVAFLALGVIGYAIVNRFVYPVARRNHEQAKLTGDHGLSPRTAFLALRAFALVGMPVLGFVLGERLAALF